ncbi:hypothetical protein DFH08DRAFT_1084042 [Mycena albidolilacea]|uniref:Uncharacterized protein n=1 Tax=Mycena albidolilacea TaxID=1033008 RepID=A0AAD6ZP30_9AGAR|nr:hypothetical protein DFH08DRAFT_1084042 [Mycena albidolilacea]
METVPSAVAASTAAVANEQVQTLSDTLPSAHPPASVEAATVPSVAAAPAAAEADAQVHAIGAALPGAPLSVHLPANAEAQTVSLTAAAPTAVEADAQHATGAALPDAPQSAVEAVRAGVMTAWKAIGWPESTEREAGVTWNEDESVFPGVGATCRSCRAEWLSRCVEQGEISSAAAASDIREEGGGGDEECGGKGSEASKAAAFLRKCLDAAPAEPRTFSPEDAVKAVVRDFVDFGEGTISGVLGFAAELEWLRAETRWEEMMLQATAARDREYEEMKGGSSSLDAYGDYDYDEYGSELADDDCEDDATSSLERSVKDMALTDWARARVLNGAWVTLAADLYYKAKVNGLEPHEYAVNTVHPVPWSISPPSSPPHAASYPRSTAPSSTLPPLPASTITTTPGPGTFTSIPVTHPAAPAPPAPAPRPPPPTLALAEAANAVHTRQLRAVLLPALQNVVRRVVGESAGISASATADSVTAALAMSDSDTTMDGGQDAAGVEVEPDPALRVLRMSFADIVRMLREEGVWTGDANTKREGAERDADRNGEHKNRRAHLRDTRGSDDSPPTSDTVPSPALSASTMRTTPSPPPLDLEHTAVKVDCPTIPNAAAPERAPVLSPPRLLRTIPYIPESIAHLPGASLEAIEAVWREACGPLYDCRCTVCERARAALPATSAVSSVARPLTPAPTVQPRYKEELTDWQLALAEGEAEEAAEREREIARDRRRWGVPVGYANYGDPYEDEAEGSVGFVLAAGRKRPAEEPEVGGDGDGADGRMSLKRVRMEQFVPLLGKRRLGELDFDEPGRVDAASVGSAPKRARVKVVEGLPDLTSTPVAAPMSVSPGSDMGAR